jgi:hypothetical protein
MRASEVLQAMAQAGVRLALDAEGRLVLDGEGPAGRDLVELLRADARLKVLVQWAVVGADTGHAWRVCQRCGAERLAPAGGRARCRLTPGCDGALAPPVVRLEADEEGLWVPTCGPRRRRRAS